MSECEPSAAESLVEAFAWWSIGPARDRRSLSNTAAVALADGLDSSGLRELAYIDADHNSFEVDGLITRINAELSLEPVTDSERDMLAARKLSRWVLAGEVRERELSRWAHDRFHHESEIDVFNRLAELDDDLDQTGLSGRRAGALSDQIRNEASRLLERPSPGDAPNAPHQFSGRGS